MSTALSLQSVRKLPWRPVTPWAKMRNIPLRYESSAMGHTQLDQTKESNNPSKGPTSEHKSQAEQAGSDKSGDHPAKQPDPQPSPSKATGVRRDGPGSKAGEGEDKGVTKDDGVLPSTGV